jgi:3-oxocholest-4-en-26-oate---CoA ligase
MTKTFNLADLLEVVAEAVPERLAFVCGEQQLTYRELNERSTQLASAMRQLGIGRGDNVGIELYNSAAYMEAFFACCKIGAAPANINYRYVAEELGYLLGSLDLKAVFYHSAFAAELDKATPKLPKLQHRIQVDDGTEAVPLAAGALDYEALLAQGDRTIDDPERSDNDLYLLCTGGTTGMPKGVMWPHRSLFMGALGGGGIYFRRPPIAHPEELATLVPTGPATRFFAIAPMMHGAANWSSLISLFAGHTVVVNDQHHFHAEHIWDVVDRDQANIISVVGDAMAQPLVQALENHPGRWKLNTLQVLGNGGAALSEGMQQRIKAVLPNIFITNGIGSSETGVMGSGTKPKDGEGLMVLAPSPEIAVIDDQHRIVTQPGDTGVLARTGHTPIGYYGDPVKSAETFVKVDGTLWVLSGDQARINADGQIVVLGRGSQCINTGGEKVFPEEVEGAVRHYRAVADVLVVGLPDERWGQKVTAVVEVAPGHSFDAAEMDRICREHLSGYKVPKTVVLAERIQRSPAGKANYRWAKDHAASHPAV